MDTIPDESLSNFNTRMRLNELWGRNYTLTQESAAQQMGITQSGVSQYLRGVIELNIEIIIKFARVLNVYPYEIDPTLDWKNFKSQDNDNERANELRKEERGEHQ